MPYRVLGPGARSGGPAIKRARHLWRTTILSLSAIALFCFLCAAIIVGYVSRLERNGELVNAAGRQRMLSQRIALSLLTRDRESPRRDVAEMRRVHRHLLIESEGDPSAGRSLSSLEAIVRAGDARAGEAAAEAGRLTRAMDGWVGRLAERGRRQVNFVGTVAFLLALACSVALAAVGRFIYRPLVGRLYESERTIEAQVVNLSRAESIVQLGSWTFEPSRKAVSWSDGMYEVLGYRPGETAPSYEAFARVVHPEDVAELEALVARAASEGVGYRTEYRIVKPGGEVRHLSSCCQPMEGGRVLSGTVTDVTEARRAKAELEAANALLTSLAAQDGLTGLANRRAFDERLASELARAARDGSDLSIAMIDVDRFKQYNDAFGHQAGDDALRLVASVLRASSRESDFVARYGGEEMVVVMPGASPSEAVRVAERLRTNVERALWPLRPVTISVGTATSPSATLDARALTVGADEALYRAKAAGRNRVEAFEREMDGRTIARTV